MNLKRARKVFLGAMGFVALIAFVLGVAQGFHGALDIAIQTGGLHSSATPLASFWSALFQTFATVVYVGALIATGVTVVDGILHWWRESSA